MPPPPPMSARDFQRLTSVGVANAGHNGLPLCRGWQTHVQYTSYPGARDVRRLAFIAGRDLPQRRSIRPMCTNAPDMTGNRGTSLNNTLTPLKPETALTTQRQSNNLMILRQRKNRSSFVATALDHRCDHTCGPKLQALRSLVTACRITSVGEAPKRDPRQAEPHLMAPLTTQSPRRQHIRGPAPPGEAAGTSMLRFSVADRANRANSCTPAWCFGQHAMLWRIRIWPRGAST